jgi:hypothetical protein
MFFCILGNKKGDGEEIEISAKSNKGNGVKGNLRGLILLCVSNGIRAKGLNNSMLSLLEFNAEIIHGRGPKGSTFN